MMKGYKIIHNKPEKEYDYLPHTIDGENKMPIEDYLKKKTSNNSFYVKFAKYE